MRVESGKKVYKFIPPPMVPALEGAASSSSDAESLVVQYMTGEQIVLPPCEKIWQLKVQLAHRHNRIASDMILLHKSGETEMKLDEDLEGTTHVLCVVAPETRSSSDVCTFAEYENILWAHASMRDSAGLRRAVSRAEEEHTHAEVRNMVSSLLFKCVKEQCYLLRDAASELKKRNDTCGAWKREGTEATRVDIGPLAAVIDVLLTAGEADIDYISPLGETCLHNAVKVGNEGITRLLLKYNANADVTTANDVSPLFLACRLGNAEIVDVLMEHHVDATRVNRNGATALGQAAAGGHLRIVQRLLQATNHLFVDASTSSPPLVLACSFGHTEVVRTLLAHEAYVGTRNKHETTALFAAVAAGHTGCVGVLVEYRVNVSYADRYGRRAADVAAMHNHTDIISILESARF